MAATNSGFSAEQRRMLPTILVPAFMSLLSVSIVNVTLPAIGDSLDASTSGLQWVISGYALVFGVLLVASGRAGDVWGRGRLFVLGLAVFGLGALCSGLAPNILVLNLARVIMGIGSGLLNPQVTGIIQQFFQGELRGRAFGAFGGIVGVSVAIGPILGGGLIALFGEEIGWRASFLVNVPIAIGGIFAARAYLPASTWHPLAIDDPSATTHEIPVITQANAAQAQRARSDFDPVGMLLLAAGTLFVMLPFMEAALGWWVWSSLLIGVALVVLWVRWELRYRARGRTPMVDMDLFRTRSFSNGALLIGLYFVGNTSIWLLVAQYMQRGLGHDALTAGMMGLPAALTGAITAPIAGRYVVRIGRVMVLWGLLLVVLGLGLSIAVVLLHGTAGVSEWWLLGTLALTGIGQGLIVSPNQTLSLADVPLRYAGSAGGVLQTGQRIGTAIGIAVITSVAFSVATTSGWDNALAIGFAAIIAVAGLAITVAVMDLRGTRRAAR
ncbi:MFS transporter [Gulosibacter sp. ACHW.36C]|uniref:MFS transporter n=1 Tax=Gulosibacter sediminis TaxID=1729695 RepID=A0ABY4N184_9MICO|nr:MFS transporter [Gulosibacter sediminis]UQN15794.1 MFS transporter [Gulosibacter sediminis]